MQVEMGYKCLEFNDCADCIRFDDHCQSSPKDEAGNNFPIWDGFSFRANGQRSYSPVRRAGKIVAHSILLFGLKGRDCGPSGLNQTFAARKTRPFGPGCRITPLQVEI
jgi:hypothetical protein